MSITETCIECWPTQRIKQVIVVRHDLKMRRGKQIASGAHASMSFICRRLLQRGSVSLDDFSEVERTWLTGAFAKVCCRVDSEDELMAIHDKAVEAGLEVHLITDSGKTEFHGEPTRTCSAIGHGRITIGVTRSRMTLATHPYSEQVLRWPTSGRHILAQFDDETIIVYQAYRPEIGHFAVTHCHFGGEFSYSRMSWIKPTFLWMMYRSNWGRSQGQEVVLAIRLRRTFFDSLLEQAVPSSFVPELFESLDAWTAAVARSDVRLQWDPDHDPSGGKCERRAIQLGLRGKTLEAYGKNEIVEIIDMSDFVAQQLDFIGDGQSGTLLTPTEHVYVPKGTTAAANVGLTDWRGNSSENGK